MPSLDTLMDRRLKMRLFDCIVAQRRYINVILEIENSFPFRGFRIHCLPGTIIRSVERKNKKTRFIDRPCRFIPHDDLLINLNKSSGAT